MSRFQIRQRVVNLYPRFASPMTEMAETAAARRLRKKFIWLLVFALSDFDLLLWHVDVVWWQVPLIPLIHSRVSRLEMPREALSIEQWGGQAILS